MQFTICLLFFFNILIWCFESILQGNSKFNVHLIWTILSENWLNYVFVLTSSSCVLPAYSSPQTSVPGLLKELVWWYSSMPPSQTIQHHFYLSPLPLWPLICSVVMVFSNASLLIINSKYDVCLLFIVVQNVLLTLVQSIITSYFCHLVNRIISLRNNISIAAKFFLIWKNSFKFWELES